AVGDEDVFLLDSKKHQQIETGDCRRAGARADYFHFADVLADHDEAIEDGGRRDDGGTMLVIVKYGNLQPFAQLALDVEALRRFDVFEIDPAERGLERGDDVDQLVLIA